MPNAHTPMATVAPFDFLDTPTPAVQTTNAAHAMANPSGNHVVQGSGGSVMVTHPLFTAG